MMRRILPIVAGAAGVAAEVVYITDLPIYTQLAPCAAYALSANVQRQTKSNCPEAVTDLQSCVCTKNNNFASISTAVSSSVSWSCGGTATDDFASANTVLDAYCDQSTTVTFPAEENPVSMYITDLPAFQDLAPCAAAGVSYAVMRMTHDECPEAATLLAPCVCARNQNSLKASQIINTSVKYRCDSHSADITSAQALFSAYCNMNDGTTVFPTTEKPPGDMTYYITALSEYSSLAPCAQSAVQRALTYATYSHCPAGPQALASCACIKESMSTSLSSSISSDVKYYCDKTATEDVSSALEVFAYYCGAARSEVVAAGITESIADPTNGPLGSQGGTVSGSGSAKETEAGSSNSRDGDADADGEGKSNVALIAGIAGAVAAALAVAGILTFFNMKRRKAKAESEAAAHNMVFPPSDGPNAAMAGAGSIPSSQSPGDFGKAELGGTELQSSPAAGQFGFGNHGGSPASPSPSMAKIGAVATANRMENNVSPVSAHSNAYGAPPSAVELGGGQGNAPPVPPVPQVAELPTPVSAMGTYPPPPQAQVGHGGAYEPPQQAAGQPIYEAPTNQPPLTDQSPSPVSQVGYPQPPPLVAMGGPGQQQQQYAPPQQQGYQPYGQQPPAPSPYGQYPQYVPYGQPQYAPQAGEMGYQGQGGQ